MNFAKLKEISNYKSEDENDPCGAEHFAKEGVLVFPCSDEKARTRGLMEVKTAWRPMTNEDDASKFLVRDAVVFEEDTTKEKTYNAILEKYVLLGIHIIHKTNNFRHFFIATWEHSSLESAGYKYVVSPF